MDRACCQKQVVTLSVLTLQCIKQEEKLFLQIIFVHVGSINPVLPHYFFGTNLVFKYISNLFRNQENHIFLETILGKVKNYNVFL